MLKLHHKCKHQCQCTCSSEIGKCIINDARRQVAHKKQRKYMVFGEISPNTFYTQCFEGRYELSTQKKT
jgi:hypothetical protein